jgi:hypothetical protein
MTATSPIPGLSFPKEVHGNHIMCDTAIPGLLNRATSS